MTKWLFTVLLLLAATPAGAEPIVAKLATIAPDGTPWAEQLQEYKKRVETAAGGRLKLRTFMGGALGDENATVAETRRGAIQIWGGSSAALADAVPALAMLELPYLFRNEAEADYILDDVLFADLEKKLAERGFVLLFWAENGYRSMGSRFGKVTTPAALKGRKMRAQQADIHLEMWRALGASPVPIATSEVLSALGTGVVDGFDQTPLFTFAASWHKGITDYTVTNHIYQPGVVVASKPWFDKLPAELKKILIGDPRAEAKKGRAGVRAITPMLLQNFENAGIKVHRPTEAELASFAKATEPVYAAWMNGKGRLAKPLVEKAQRALRERRAKGASAKK